LNRTKGVGLAAQILSPGRIDGPGLDRRLSWGEDDFNARLEDVTGTPWPKGLENVLDSLQPVPASLCFDDFRVSHHRFERKLDAESFVAVTRTYGGHHASERDQLIRHLIENEFGGEVTKVEDAVLYLARRR
jgi:hypothetical protein